MQQTTTSNGIQIVAIDMPIKNVVSFAGSFAAGEILSPKDAPALASLTAAMLDKGTAKQDRFALAEKLDRWGADIGFTANAHSLNIAGRFLRQDADSVIELLAEQLRPARIRADSTPTAQKSPARRLTTSQGQHRLPCQRSSLAQTLFTRASKLQPTTSNTDRRHRKYHS